MIANYGNISYLTPSSMELLLSRCTNQKYRALIAVLKGCGLRVTEARTSRWDDFDFMHKTLTIYSLKKRENSRKKKRTIPLADWVIKEMADWWKDSKAKKENDLVFYGQNLDKPLSRQQIDRKLKKLMPNISAHKLRHTFATELAANSTDLLTIKELMGHEDIRTTQIYTHIPAEKLELAIQKTNQATLSKRLWRKVFPKKPIVIIPMSDGMTNYHVGRKGEIEKLVDLAEKKVNVLLTGKQGIGKTHLLDNLNIPNIIRIDEWTSLKKTIGGILLKLYNGDKLQILALMTEQADMSKYIVKENTKNLIELLINSTQPKEYTLIIDDVTAISASGVRALEKLKNHFHIICAAREVKISKATFLTNFQKIQLNELSRPETIELIDLASHKIRNRIEDYEAFKNHVFESTNGNPLFVLEMIERYRVEPEITIEVIKEVKHTAALKEIDMSMIVVILLSSLMVLRYIGGEFDDDSGAFKLIGGMFLVFALFARNIFNAGKRKFV